MHAVCRAAYVSPGASPSSVAAPSPKYGVSASLDSAAWAETGAGGLPTLGVVTVVSGPFCAAAVQAVSPAQQQMIRKLPVRMRIRRSLAGARRLPALCDASRLAEGRGLRRLQQRRELPHVPGVHGAVLLDRGGE